MDMQGVRTGTLSARDTLYRRFHGRVLAYLSAFAVDADTLWDLTHDVFVKAYEGAARFEGEPGALAPWLLVIARNTALDHLRVAGRTQSEEPQRIERRRERDVEHSRPQWGDNAAVHRAIAGLPNQQRAVLEGHYRDDRDATELGRVLGKSADAVRHIEQRALTTIRDRLSQQSARGGVRAS